MVVETTDAMEHPWAHMIEHFYCIKSVILIEYHCMNTSMENNQKFKKNLNQNHFYTSEELSATHIQSLARYFLEILLPLSEFIYISLNYDFRKLLNS